MAVLDPFDLVKRLGQAPLGPLVDALRRVHVDGTGDSRALLDVLADRTGAAATPSPTADAAPASNPPDYEAARQLFVRHAAKLREQAILAEKLLDGFARHASAPTVSPLQQELRIRCAPGGTSSARFVVVNRLERAVDVLFRAGHVHGVSADASAPVRVAFDPDQPRLDPGAEREVRIVVELPLEHGLRDPLELGVDVMGNEQLLLKLWVHIEIALEVSSERPRPDRL